MKKTILFGMAIAGSFALHNSAIAQSTAVYDGYIKDVRMMLRNDTRTSSMTEADFSDNGLWQMASSHCWQLRQGMTIRQLGSRMTLITPQLKGLNKAILVSGLKNICPDQAYKVKNVGAR